MKKKDKKNMDLSVVIPVYNEQECIKYVLDSWLEELNQLNISFCIYVINDGSKDDTAETLWLYNSEPNVKIIHKQNSGHGPSLLAGYRLAVKSSAWVFQVDSDDEMKAKYFKQLWEARLNYDAVFGVRQNRKQSIFRRLITLTSRITVYSLYGSRIVDVNVPFRLMKAQHLEEALTLIPVNTFAPNILISGFFNKRKYKIKNLDVPYQFRQTGKLSLLKGRLIKAAVQSFMQVLFFCWKLRKI